ncbi:pyocin knob domain-containing protein [Telmatospirillum sp. J64-1]|uniref:pyocin knob domain-containing protein n=1 Tax=Telmatospirillum sp. J64-1 TaxID=2502183 RepID=UPI00115F2BAD|nr:pyocin knob domain-containing protein [Telmatospirillum sp. J64-1]
MPFELADRVHETTTTTGVGSISLGGAANASKVTFLRGIGAGNTTCYCMTDGSAFEVGIGTVNAGSPPTLARNTVLASSNNNNLVNWASGAKAVFGVAPAALLMLLAKSGAGTSRPWYAAAGTIWTRSSDWAALLFDGQQDRRLLQAGDVENALPARLGRVCQTITDWNDALENGDYMGNNAANSPVESGSATWWMGSVEAHNSNYVTQTVHAFSTANEGASNTYLWRRDKQNGVWQPWYKLQWSQVEQDARYALNSHLAQFGIATNTVTLRNASPNTLTNGGSYYLAPHADLPMQAYGYLHTEAADVTNHRKQEFTPQHANRTFMRRMASNIWSPWTEYITTDNIGNYAPPGLGIGQTWQDVTAQRQINTTYQNPTNRSMQVAVMGRGSSTGAQAFKVSPDNSVWTTVGNAGGNNIGNSYNGNVNVIIPPRHYYRVEGGGIFYWAETINV